MIGLHPLSREAVAIRRDLEAIGCKWCPECKRVRHRSHFNKQSARRDGLQARCAECGSKRASAYQAANRDRLTERHREWVANNRERHSAWMAAYRQRPERKALHARRAAAARATVSGQLKNRIATRLYHVLRGGKGGSRTEALVGWTIAELRGHLERQFLKGMSWENMGEWHIDHILPLSSFVIEGPDDPELRRAWALTNLRPLWAADNIRKGARVETIL